MVKGPEKDRMDVGAKFSLCYMLKYWVVKTMNTLIMCKNWGLLRTKGGARTDR